MEQEGSGRRSGPSPLPGDLEHARRRVYRRDVSLEEVRAYERLLHDSRPSHAPTVQEDGDGVVPLVRAPASGRWPTRIGTTAGVAAIVAALIVAVLLPRGAPRPPDRLEPPESAGRTLVTLARDHDPATRADSLSYQPAGYTVFRPGRGVVRVGLRCQGPGTVVVGVGVRLVFRCTDRLRILARTAPSPAHPFVIIATTTGDVVWGARVSVR